MLAASQCYHNHIGKKSVGTSYRTLWTQAMRIHTHRYAGVRPYMIWSQEGISKFIYISVCPVISLSFIFIYIMYNLLIFTKKYHFQK